MRNTLLNLTIFFLFLNTTNGQGVKQLWGATHGGGIDGGGTIFSLTEDGSGFKKRHDFKVKYQGNFPSVNEMIEVDSKFYGTTKFGGAYGLGILFEWDPSNNNYNKKADFKSNIGVTPFGGLLFYNNKIYGTAHIKGTLNIDSGALIFEFDLVTNSLSKKVFLNTPINPSNVFSSGMTLYNGKIYGVVDRSGTNGRGLIYEYDIASNTATTIKDIDAGMRPSERSSLTVYNSKLYGLIEKSSNNSTVIYEIDPATNTFLIKKEFTTTSAPIGSLSEFSGKLYGFTRNSIFEYELLTNNSLIKHTINNSIDGFNISCNKLLLRNNKFYGATKDGGVSFGGYGTLFEWDPVGNAFLTKINFPKTDVVFTGLCLKNNMIYGIQGPAGFFNEGRVFSYNADNNTYNVLFHFNYDDKGLNSVNNLYSRGSKFYGFTERGGVNFTGVVFEYNRQNNHYKIKANFDSTGPLPSDGGYNAGVPEGLAFELNGKLYGFGQRPTGQIFEWDTTNTIISTKKVFDNTFTSLTQNGNYPNGGLTLYNNKFYGICTNGGVNQRGVIFEWDHITNTYTNKFNLSSTNGRFPEGMILVGTKFYGVAGDGDFGVGSFIFEWDPVTNSYLNKIDFGTASDIRLTGQLLHFNNKIFGLSAKGGSNNSGVLFEWDYASNTLVKKHDFVMATGIMPQAGLTVSNGKLYGLTSQGGLDNLGVAFEYDLNTNTYTKKFDFDGINGIPYKNNLVLIDASIASPTPNTCTSFSSITIDNSNNNQWVPIINEFGDVLAEIKANGNNLGVVSTNVYINGGPVREDANKKIYLDRSFSITPQFQPTTSVDIRLYITEAEFNALKNATNSVGQPSGITSINDISIFKNNDACNNQIIASTSQVNNANAVYDGGGYVLIGSVNSFSSFYFAKNTSALPLRFLDLTAKTQNENVLLNWNTTDEYNTDYFIVEKSYDGRKFEAVGRVPAKGNSIINQYEFTDAKASLLGKTHIYYRILQKDIDSKESYSSITSVSFSIINDVIHWPNPVKDKVNLLFTIGKKEKVSIRILDMNGRVLKRDEFTVDKGSFNKSYETSVLDKGMYILEVNSGLIRKNLMFVKQ